MARPEPAERVVRTEFVEVPVIAYQPLPGVLTAPIPAPPQPPARCTWGEAPAVCVLDALATLPAWEAALGMCNADRRRAASLGRSDGVEAP